MRFGTGRFTALTVVLATTTVTTQISTLSHNHPTTPASPKRTLDAAAPADSHSASLVHPFLEYTLELNSEDVFAAIEGRPSATTAGVLPIERTRHATPDAAGDVVAIRLAGAPIRFGDLPVDVQLDAWLRHGHDVEATYERVIADHLDAAIDHARAERPGVLLTALDLPLDRPHADHARLRASNRRFACVIDRLDLLVVPSVLEPHHDRRAELMRRHPTAFEAAGLRPLVHRVGDEWHAILPALGGPASQEGGGVDTPPVLVPSRDRDRALPIRTPRRGVGVIDDPSVPPPGGDPGGSDPGGGDPDDPTVPPEIPGGDPDGPTVPPEEPDAPTNGDRPDFNEEPLDPQDPTNGQGDPDGEIDFDRGTDIIRPRGDGGGKGGASGPTIEGGTGFDGSFVAPPRQGSPGQRGYERQAIARWNAVPHQDVSQPFEVGVMAFHFSGIRHVTFQLDGGPIETIAEPSINPRTGTEEYWVRIDPSLLIDGNHELRAIAVPNRGEPRVLAGPIDEITVDDGEVSWFFNSNGQGTLPYRFAHVAPAPAGNDLTGDGTRDRPFATLMRATFALAGDKTYGDAGGGSILLLPGDYNLGTYAWPSIVTTDERWITIQPASGVLETDVRIVSASDGGIRVPKLRLFNVRITPLPGAVNPIRGQNESELWLDDCSIVGETFYPDMTTRTIVSGFSGGRYATDTLVKDVISTPIEGTLARNVSVDGVLEDAIRARVIVNCSVRNQSAQLYPNDYDFHADVWQLFVADGVLENCVVNGLVATENVYAQGLFFRGDTDLFRDLAFVDVHIDNTWNGDPDSILVNFHAFEPFEHVLVLESTFRGGGRYVEPGQPEGNFSAVDVLFCRVHHLVTGEPFLPDPDGPTSWTPGRWPGTLPWSSPSGLHYTDVAPWEPGGYPAD